MIYVFKSIFPQLRLFESSNHTWAEVDEVWFLGEVKLPLVCNTSPLLSMQPVIMMKIIIPINYTHDSHISSCSNAFVHHDL